MRLPHLVLGLTLVPLTLIARQEPPQGGPFRAEANYVRVDFYAMRDGRPVTDLVQSDVEVLDQGAPQTIAHLGTIPEGRKAVITLSSGLRLFREDPNLRRQLPGQTTQQSPFGPDPLRTSPDNASRNRATDAAIACEGDRTALSYVRNDQRFQEMLNRANRANVSFYPIDPRRVTVFDEDPIPAAGVGVNPPVNVFDDRERLAAREDSLRTMADFTDGLAVVDTSNVEAALRRIGQDLSSYYLVGFYSTERQDGKIHKLTVRIKRPGVAVRARRGYLAASGPDGRATTVNAPSTRAPEPNPVDEALAALGSFARERSLYVRAAAASSGNTAIWVVAEAPAQTARNDWRSGALANVILADADGRTVATADLPISPGATSARVALRTASPLPAGEYRVQVRVIFEAPGALAANDVYRLTVASAPMTAGALFTRRGPTTGNRDLPTSDLRFRRTERVVMEVPALSADSGSARLLDRTGRPLSVPVTTAIREEADGARWRTAQVTLASLAPGDYVISVEAGEERTQMAIRVVP